MHLSRMEIRLIGATCATLMAGIYYLIGFGVLSVGGTTSGDAVDLFGFGVGAGTAFLVVAVLLLLTDRRWIWWLTLCFQVLVFVTYVAVSGTRLPPFETWGITLRTIQLVVIGCLVYLAIAAPHQRSEAIEQ